MYVLPEYVNGRPTEPHGVVHKADRETLEAASSWRSHLRRNEDMEALFDLDASDDPFPRSAWPAGVVRPRSSVRKGTTMQDLDFTAAMKKAVSPGC